MKDKFIKLIMSIISMIQIVIFVLFCIIFLNEFQIIQTSGITQNIEKGIKDTLGEISKIDGETENEKNKEKEENDENKSENTIEKEIQVPEVIENPLDKLADPNTSNKNVSYENVTVDKYFYSQLESYSQLIYKAFESNKEEMKTGTYQIEFGSAFSSLLNEANGQELLNSYYQSAIEAYLYDNPEVFYLNPNKMYLNIETTTRGSNKTYNAYINSGNQASYLTDEFSSKQQIDEAFKEIEAIRDSILQNKTGNAYEDIKMVHDYIINNTEYDTSLSKPNIYNIYGALINKQAVCEGYARAFKYMMDALGIPCTLVIGQGTNSEGKTENHAWNYVKLEEIWYAIDTTWDDPVSTTGWVSESSKYKYFLKGSSEFSKDHIPNGQFSEGGKMFSYPELSKEGFRDTP